MPDARTERWAEHRAAERRRIVDVAKDAIEDIGPQLTMNEIAARACVPKPALYRFFVAKSELMQAVAERARDDVVAELFRLSDTTPETLGDLLGAALSGYASLIQTYPNLSRYLFFGVENAGAYTAENSRTVAHLIEPLLTATIAPGQPDHDVALLASMVVGAVTGAAAWWLESSDPRMDTAAFVGEIMPVISEMIVSRARRSGLSIDLDTPVPDSWDAQFRSDAV